MGRGAAYDFRYVSGAHNVTCQRCAGQFKNYELRREWDNLWVCHTCWEPRNPQDFVRGIPDRQSVPWTTGDPPWVSVVRVDPPGLRTLDAYIIDSISIG